MRSRGAGNVGGRPARRAGKGAADMMKDQRMRRLLENQH
ncbi:hypothetical protein D554_1243 [Bordetella holmesii 30539]|uniref:N-acetyltransferase YedL n=1 Tax=Bordetella holmesii 1058 TaxID=1247648 RepID=A0ABP3BM48_9BORD|nr:hypothetical protein D558_1768 [Bordetella holmesii 44057]EWM43105.1 hypothetical protein D556_1779 [Bordetella holmesii 41130]EWM47010.1 hypothetical protein D555_1792 [Bordetella holmesii 35009]EXF90036.1 hypothetical protein D554_1243 [Bordetella holmesii 30539]EXX96243.1 hypothetical protein D559_3688 [Bordetella holmesii 1058]